MRSLALKGRRFETWDELCSAVEAATAYWNVHPIPSSGAVGTGTGADAGSPIALLPSVT